MVASNLQITKKMVKYIFTIVFAQVFIICAISQEKPLENEILFRASFSRDSVFMGDSLEIKLYFRNDTNSSFSLYPKAIIGLTHNHKEFITYDKPERIAYKLNCICDYDSVIILNPGEGFENMYHIKAEDNFFYIGMNDILVFYHLYEKPLKWKKYKVDKGKPILSLWSPVVKINVQSNK